MSDLEQGTNLMEPPLLKCEMESPSSLGGSRIKVLCSTLTHGKVKTGHYDEATAAAVDDGDSDGGPMGERHSTAPPIVYSAPPLSLRGEDTSLGLKSG